MLRQEKTEITIETEHLLIFRYRRRARRWCDSCGHETDFVPCESALQFRTVFADQSQRIELHFVPGENSQHLLCLESLLKVAQSAIAKRNQSAVAADWP